jgi:hypothetical protein
MVSPGKELASPRFRAVDTYDIMLAARATRKPVLTSPRWEYEFPLKDGGDLNRLKT